MGRLTNYIYYMIYDTIFEFRVIEIIEKILDTDLFKNTDIKFYIKKDYVIDNIICYDEDKNEYRNRYGIKTNFVKSSNIIRDIIIEGMKNKINKDNTIPEIRKDLLLKMVDNIKFNTTIHSLPYYTVYFDNYHKTTLDMLSLMNTLESVDKNAEDILFVIDEYVETINNIYQENLDKIEDIEDELL